VNVTTGTLIDGRADPRVQALHRLIVTTTRAVGHRPTRHDLARLVARVTELGRKTLAALTADWGDTRKYPDRPTLCLHDGDEAVPTFWLLGWRPEESTPIHDHRESEVGVAVVKVAVGEEVFHGAHRTTREFYEGSVVNLKAPYVHRMFGLSEGHALCCPLGVTLHAYYPALTDMGFFDYEDGRLVQTGEWKANTPAAQARAA
jgi:hypothetical protein